MPFARTAYFDNAATSYPKPDCVYSFADSFYREFGANAGRGQYAMASRASTLIESTREALLKLYNCEDKQVVFTSSATEALNKVLLGLPLKRGDAVYLSPFEHNSVTRVVHALERELGIRVKLLPFNKSTLEFDSTLAKEQFGERPPSVVVTTHASNVCGAILPVEHIFSLAKECQAVTVLDMSQTAGLIDLELSSQDIDYAVFAGHKSLFAPFGVGGFVCGYDAMLEPVFFGGTGADSKRQGVAESLRERIEVGSPNIYALAGLNASLKWIAEQGMSNLRLKEQERTETLLDTLCSFSNITVVPRMDTIERIGVVSALFDNYSPDEIGAVLNKEGIAVRSGLHCSPYAHEFLGTSPTGTVRFSVSCYTKDNDFDILHRALTLIRQA